MKIQKVLHAIFLFFGIAPLSLSAQIIEGLSYEEKPTTITLSMPEQNYQVTIPAEESKLTCNRDFESVWITETKEILSLNEMKIEFYINTAPERDLKRGGLRVELRYRHKTERYDLSASYIDSLLYAMEQVEHIYSKSIPEIEETRYYSHVFKNLYFVLYNCDFYTWKMKFLFDNTLFQTKGVNEDTFKKVLERLREAKEIVKTLNQ